MPLHAHHPEPDTLELRPQFAEPGETRPVPKNRLPERGMPPSVARQIVGDELLLDGSARLNLATFVTTWMEREAGELMAACADKNIVDRDEYPQTAELERRCVSMLADLWHAPGRGSATGCSTTGSSEAAMLAGLALKWRWRASRRSAGEPDDRPNLVMGANVQVCWEKFCRYFDVEPRLVPVGPDSTHLTPAAAAHCDDRTIGVVAVLGSTYDGSYEPVTDIVAALDRLASAGGPDVPVHVDAASGGFVAPFLDPDLEWDFRLDRVSSINASGHKYGLVYPGVGWALWRDRDALPADLVFDVAYLGGHMPTFALNFSRPGAQVVAQYYTFLRLGRDGYRRVQQACRDTASWLADDLERRAPLRRVWGGPGIPAVALTVDENEPFDVYDLCEALRTRNWLVPAYPMPTALEATSVLRVVVRNGFSRDMAGLLADAMVEEVAELRRRPVGQGSRRRQGFHH